MSVINTNVNAVLAQNSLVKNERAMSTAMEQLSTGKRINSAADDAAGLAIASKMTAQIRGLDQAVRNINDAVSMVQTAEGATGEITNMLQRMRELAVQTNSGTYTDEDKANIELEFQALLTGIDNIADTTQWNGMNILDGTGSTTVFQIGANDSQTITVNLGNLQSDAFTAGSAGSNVVDTSAAEVALMTSATVGDVTVALSGLTSTEDLKDALNADATFALSYLATESITGSQVTITEISGAFTSTGPAVTLTGSTTPVAGQSVLTISDDEANALTSVVAGAVTVNSAALLAATTVSGVADALNADTTFAASYLATAATGSLTISEVASAITTAGPTVTTTATTAFASTGTVGAGTGSPVVQSNTLTISDTEAGTLSNFTATAASGTAVTVTLSATSNVTTLADELNADSSFSGLYTATASSGSLLIEEIIATTGTGVVVATTSSGSFSSTGTVGAGNAAAVVQSNTLTITDAEAQTLTSLDVTANGGTLVTVDTSGATDVDSLADILTADSSFAALYTATASSGSLLIEEITATTGTGIVLAPTATSYTDSVVLTGGTEGTSTTVTAGAETILGFGADISALTSTDDSVLATLDTALAAVATQNATNGAAINRLEYTADSLANVSLNTQASRSRIEDADYAKATTELARTQIIQQAGTAMLAQANQQAQGVLALLQ